MKLVSAIVLFATAALAAPGFQPIELRYHEAIGIPKAAAIKAAEEATDFDGSRIFGGSPARLGQFPYMGGLLITLQNGRNSVCGSSLLTNTRLVTAAHCWFDGQQSGRTVTVVLGSIHLFSGGRRINTSQVVIHPQYNVNTIQNDVAVITIPHVGFDNNIRSVNLASGSASYVGQTAVAVGFGVTGPGAGIPNNQVLSFASLVVITNDECRSFFSSQFVVASTLCTSGAQGRNICSSDSGGPLVIGNNLIGVTSFGAGVCGNRSPAGFARVTSFASWIRQHL